MTQQKTRHVIISDQMADRQAQPSVTEQPSVVIEPDVTDDVFDDVEG